MVLRTGTSLFKKGEMRMHEEQDGQNNSTCTGARVVPVAKVASLRAVIMMEEGDHSCRRAKVT
jgi:hypothetical protein